MAQNNAQPGTLCAAGRKQGTSPSRAPQSWPCQHGGITVHHCPSLCIALLAQGAAPHAGQVAVIVLLTPPHAAEEIVLVRDGLQEVGPHQADVVQLRGRGAPGAAAASLREHLRGEQSKKAPAASAGCAWHEHSAWEQRTHPAGGRPASLLGFQLTVSPAKQAGGRGQGSRLHSRGRRCSFSGCPLPPRWLFWLGTSSSRRVAGTPLRKRLHQASGRKPRCDAANPRKASANSAAVAATACCQNGLRAAKIIRSHLAGWVPEEP